MLLAFCALQIGEGRTQCNSHPVPQEICDLSPNLCVTGYCYVNEVFVDNTHFGWCGMGTALSNPHYFALIANDVEMSIEILVNECFQQGQQGYMQCALIDNCEWDNSNVLECINIWLSDTTPLAFSGLEPGRKYWLVVDGGALQVCEYSVMHVEGFVQTPVRDEVLFSCSGTAIYRGIEYGLGTHEIVYQNANPDQCADSIITLSITDILSVAFDRDVICFPYGDEISIAPLVNQGAGPYSFFWHDGATDSLRQFTDLMPGDVVSVTVTDSEGCSGSVFVSVVEEPVSADFDYDISGHTVDFTNLSQNGSTVLWDFGDGESSQVWNASHVYTVSGIYPVTMIVYGQCGSDTLSLDVDALGSATKEVKTSPDIFVVPNPGTGAFTITGTDGTVDQLWMYDLLGRSVSVERTGINTFSVPWENVGVFTLVLRLEGQRVATRVVVMH